MSAATNDAGAERSATTRCRASASGSPATAAWSARRWCAGSRARTARCSTAARGERRPAPPGRGRALDGRQPARRPCSSPPRRSAASSPTTRCPAEFLYDNLMIEANVIDAAWTRRRREAAVPRLVLHLPEARAAADRRGRAADRPARADQRVVRDRQDRRHQAVPGLSPAVRLRLHLRHADQPLRARRQLRPRVQPRAPGADPQGARGEAARRPTDGRSGAPARRGASSCTSTTAPTRWCS